MRADLPATLRHAALGLTGRRNAGLCGESNKMIEPDASHCIWLGCGARVNRPQLVYRTAPPKTDGAGVLSPRPHVTGPLHERFVNEPWHA